MHFSRNLTRYKFVHHFYATCVEIFSIQIHFLDVVVQDKPVLHFIVLFISFTENYHISVYYRKLLVVI